MVAERLVAQLERLKGYIRRVWQRPRPWILLYGIVMVPSVLLAILTGFSLLQWTRYPLFRQALEARSLDLLLEFFSRVLANTRFGEEVSSVPSLFFSLCGVPLLWPLLGMLWVWLEGGTLITYLDAEAPMWSRFWQACRRWFGPFLLLNSVGVLVIILVAGIFIGLGALLIALIPTGIGSVLGWGLAVVGVVLSGALSIWVEMARATAVARGDRHVVHALQSAGHIILKHPLPLLVLAVSGLVLYGLLWGAHKGLMAIIPIPWWLLSFLVQQVHIMARLGVRLTRQAGEMGLVRESLTAEPEV